MRAEDARNISTTGSKDEWLAGTLLKIKRQAEKGLFEIEILIGQGSLQNKQFSNFVDSQKRKLSDLGYRVETDRRRVKHSLGFYFDYFLIINWNV